MHFQDQNWMQIENYLEDDDRLILVLGACEQHGYLSLLTDTKIPLTLADSASQETGIPIAPPLNFGCSPYFLEYPGTISLRLQTYLQVVEDIIRSLYSSGFRRFLILNGHGGNTSVKTYLIELTNQLPDMKLRWYAWWTTKTVANIGKKYDLDPQHANWLEAFEFTKVAPLPKEPKVLMESSNDILNQYETRERCVDGSFGGIYEADQAIMQEIFNACLKDVLELLEFNI